MAVGRLNPGGQNYQASGESTPEAELPEKYVSTTQPVSPLAGQLAAPSGFLTRANSSVVPRWPRMNGMRYLYQRGMHRQPIQRLGADGQPYPWDSNFNPNVHGPTHDAGFNDALYQAGYPGFNLGLSFKVPTLPKAPGNGRPALYAPINIRGTNIIRTKQSGGQNTSG